MESKDIPSSGQQWISLKQGTEFQPAEVYEDDPQSTHIRTAQHRLLSYHDKFVDGHETYYDPYSQAWRLLGFYIDCGSYEEKEGRKLEDNDDDNNYSCQRYLLWAAYVDLDYDGGGIGEYQIYHHENGWQKDACDVADSGRCVKMDCHKPMSNFQLLGYYKETSYDDFFEQLFKHEGYCIWSSEEYNFMSMWRSSWPQGCTQSNLMSESGAYLYYDLKPLPGAEIGVGVYTDAYCTIEVSHKIDVGQFFHACGDEDGNGDDGCTSLGMPSDEFMKKFNKLLNIYKTCLPCKAFDLSVTSKQYNNQNKEGENDDAANDPNEGLFQCNDDAGYTNVNQCMKFRSQTEMYAATFNDVRTASQQGTIIRPLAPGTAISRVSQANRKHGFFVFSILFFTFSLGFLFWASKRARRQRRNRRSVEPLL